VQIEIGYDDSFEEVDDNMIISVLNQPVTSSDQQFDDSITYGEFLSDSFTVSIKTSSEQIATSDTYSIDDLDQESVSIPIQIILPISTSDKPQP
jgi:hypothetical protein